MGKYDKDRHQKELAIKFCLASGSVPFLEVVVNSVSDLSDSVEVLTDLDVVGISQIGDGSLRRTLFDCKTGAKMSAINRAFWASGVSHYTGCNDSIVILKNRPVHNHRISALSMNVDLHDETSFADYGRSYDPNFPGNEWYQSSIDRWELVASAFESNAWSSSLLDVTRNIVPLTVTPWAVFRRIIAELKAVRGEFDPEKPKHLAIYMDLLSSTLVLWSVIGRDIRRFYQPTMQKADFERVFRYYIWGGREAYGIRQKMRELGPAGEVEATVELPRWSTLVQFAGLVISAPQFLFGSALAAREFSIRSLSGTDIGFDANLQVLLKTNNRANQFISGLSGYLIQAAGLPSDLGRKVESILFGK